MDDASEVFPTFEHPGIEFIYMLAGKIEYRHGQYTYLLEPGTLSPFRVMFPTVLKTDRTTHSFSCHHPLFNPPEGL